MNKKAFTLAELLGVIVILGIIGTIAIIAIDSNIKNGRYQTCLAQNQNLIEGAKTLVTKYPSVLPNAGGTTTISVDILKNGGEVIGVTVEGGHIDQNLENPMTEKPYTNNVKVVITSSNGTKFNYEVTAPDNEKCQK